MIIPRPLSGTNRGLGLLLTLLLLTTAPAAAQERATLTFQDLMKVRQIQNPVISSNGEWVALAAVPDRGDGEGLVYSVNEDARYSVPRGTRPAISHGGAWVAFRMEPTFEASETAGRGDAPRPGLALLSTDGGEVMEWEDIRSFAFSAEGGWLARLAYQEEENGEAQGGAVEEEEATEEAATEEVRTRDDPGTTLTLRNLTTGMEEEILHVAAYLFAPEGEWLAYTVESPDGEGDGVYVLELGGTPLALDTAPFAAASTLTWWEEGSRLAWVMATEDEEGEAGPGTLTLWDGSSTRVVAGPEDIRADWILPVSTRLEWSEDGDRLFFGTRPAHEDEMGEAEEEAEEEEAFDPYDMEAILDERGVDVWNTDDPLINPNQKEVWSREQSRTYLSVFRVDEDRIVRLGDTLVQLQGFPQNPVRALATSSVPYLKESTWTGGADDVYLVDLDTGDRTLIMERFGSEGSAANSWIGTYGSSLSLSPGGRYLVWFRDDDWHVYDAATGSTRNLTEGLDVPFYDVDHDYPSPRGGHGIGGWLDDDEAVLIHDKYDVWQFPLGGGSPVNLTGGEGRSRGLVLRVLSVDPEVESYAPGDAIHLASFDEGDKSFGFFRTRAGRGGLETLLDEERRFRVLDKAESADVLLFTREDYDEFPDLWVGGMDFSGRHQVTDVNPGLTERFAWGSSELVEWTSDDGIPLQGVVIKPGNYEPGKRYPVLTYFYRFFSQRLHEFNQPVINHRPSFPIYASDGYIVFLPDVRFEVGRPGLSSMKSVVPGLKKLVDMGIADPDALGLHGHSWSGYTTAFIVTQTNLFAAAVAGAPVSNMTSAYGGIRWGSGLARQFQYEQGQSRLSGSLWEAFPDYIENSPLFYADRVETPLLIMHGDEDDAVPWYQSIELYLALRRLGKKAVFLEYRGEPHHPQRYANKLDYSIRMKEFFDHFLKGAPAPTWWTEGEPYSGR